MYALYYERLKVPIFLEVQQCQETLKIWKKSSDNGKPQITMAAPGVNYRPQEASGGAS